MDFFTEQKYHREVLVIPVDFSRGMEIYPDLAEQLKDLDIGILGEKDRLHALLTNNGNNPIIHCTMS